jgi:hypothetical protein
VSRAPGGDRRPVRSGGLAIWRELWQYTAMNQSTLIEVLRKYDAALRENGATGLLMPKDPTIAVRDCLAEIAILHEIEGRMLKAMRNDE